MKSRLNTMLAGLALTVPFLVPAIGTAEEFEPVVYVSSTTSGNVDGVWFADEDILAYGTVSDSWERYFDGSDVGLRYNDVNAFHIADDGTILMALKKPQRVGGFWADDSDVIAFSPTSLGKHTAGTFEKVFDGSDVGLSTDAEEIDALAVTPDGRLLLSTSGSLKVPRSGGGTLWGADEDLIVFNAESFGTSTAGSFERYFDGSDVGLRNSSEDVWGAWVDPFSGDIAITTKANYWVPGLNGDKEDIIVFSPDSLGYQTAGTFFPGWDGDEHGLSGEYLDGLFVDLGQPSEGQWFQASLTNDWVQGWGYQPGEFVSVRVFDFFGPGNEELFSGDTPVDGDGYFFVGDLGIDLMPDMYIEVDDRALEMEDITFDVFDVDGNMIAGMAAEGTVVEFGVGNDESNTGGQTDAVAGDSWSVDLSEDPYNFDLTGAMGGQAWVSDGDGDQTVVEPPPPPQPTQFQASLTNDWVQGWSFTPNDAVTVTIFDFMGTGSAVLFSGLPGTDGQGNFNLNDLSGLDLLPGLYITVEDSVLPPRALVLEPLTFDEFDIDANMIAGTATAGATVQFGVGNEDDGRGGEIVATDGIWSVDLSAPPYNFDLTGAMGGQAWISDVDGDQTVAEPRIAQFQASLTSDWVQGWNFTPGATVAVQVFDLGDVSVFTGSTLVDQGGNFHLNELDDVVLIPGMRITVNDGVDAKELVLDELTFETFDFAADTIGGRAVTGTRVDFNVGDEKNNVGGLTTADVDGNWFVDLSTQIDIAASMGGQARVSDADGDQTVAEPRFAQFEASLTGNYIEGWNFSPDSPVTVKVFSSSTDVVPVFSGDFTTGPAGNFGVGDLGGVNLMPDMYVTVDDTDDDNDKTLNLAPLTFDEFDASSNRLAGEAPTGALVVFGVGSEFGGIGGEVTAEGSGYWSVNTNTDQFGFFNLLPSMGNGQARVYDDDGDQTVADLQVPQFHASLTGDWLQGWNFAPNSPVTVEVYEDLDGLSPGMQLFPPPVPADPDPITTGDEGSFGLDLVQYGVDLSAGNYIVVTVAGTTKTLVTVALTVKTFDVGTNVIGGTASPGTFVEFGVGDDDGGIGGVAIADGSENWSVDLFDRYGFDLTDTMGGQAWVSDFDLDRTVAEPPPPEI